MTEEPKKKDPIYSKPVNELRTKKTFEPPKKQAKEMSDKRKAKLRLFEVVDGKHKLVPDDVVRKSGVTYIYKEAK